MSFWCLGRIGLIVSRALDYSGRILLLLCIIEELPVTSRMIALMRRDVHCL